jgi:hypothetical protein
VHVSAFLPPSLGDAGIYGDRKVRSEYLVEGVAHSLADRWGKFFADIDRAKLDKIAAMADPARNDKEHERAVAASKLASFKAKRAPGMPPDPEVSEVLCLGSVYFSSVGSDFAMAR